MSDRLNLKCPKCRSRDYTLIETAEEHVIYEVRDGIKPKDATDHEAGTILGVECECSDCGYNWKPRRVTQWIDAIAD